MEPGGLHRIWNGREDFKVALKTDRIRLQGQSAIVRLLPQVVSIAALGEMAETAHSAASS